MAKCACGLTRFSIPSDLFLHKGERHSPEKCIVRKYVTIEREPINKQEN